ncbi:MAG TPA: hypothetical protein VK184_08405 [Nostocaceae cyanobacterium]|nr:hypothetical protein [Nostocaceae cyanobacterium]
MATVSFNLPHSISWKGTTYQAGIQQIPQDLAAKLANDPNYADGVIGGDGSGTGSSGGSTGTSTTKWDNLG